MSRDSKKSAIWSLVALLAGLVVAKGIWSFVAFKYLPKKGIELKQQSSLKPLYYHYNLASKKEVVRKIVHKAVTPAKIVAPKAEKPKPPEKIKYFIFKGLYNSQEKKVIVVEYVGKTSVLSIGDKMEGYKLVDLSGTVATFTKDGKKYRLELYKEQNIPQQSQQKPVRQTVAPVAKPKVAPAPQNPAAALSPKREGDTTVIPKDLFDRYRTSAREIQKQINAVPYMVNGQLSGFKVNFIKKGSDFSKLGVQRGDIITAINGEPLTNLKVPIEFFNNLDTVTAATFTIKRGNETKELEYEVR